MDFDTLRDLKSGLGTAAVIVMDKTPISSRRLPASLLLQARSCGQCTPCREGTGWMWRVMERMAKGEAEARNRYAAGCDQAG
jgi:NADH-quinone oxidoreductase subunit F